MPSPAILQEIIQHYLSQYKAIDHKVVQLLNNTLHVSGGTSSVEEGIMIYIYQHAKEIMKKGSFNLHKWQTIVEHLQYMIKRNWSDKWQCRNRSEE